MGNINTPQVRPERTGWRDEALSLRHREKYGWDCPAVDLDFVLVEFNRGEPAGLVEYKAGGARHIDLQHPSYRSLGKLASNSKVPFFVVFYDENFTYRVIPANDYAKKYVPFTKTFCERDFVRLLYKIRGLEAPEGILEDLNCLCEAKFSRN